MSKLILEELLGFLKLWAAAAVILFLIATAVTGGLAFLLWDWPDSYLTWTFIRVLVVCSFCFGVVVWLRS